MIENLGFHMGTVVYAAWMIDSLLLWLSFTVQLD